MEPPTKKSGARRARGACAAPRLAPRRQQSLVDVLRRLPVDFELTHLERVLYPEQDLRKAELIAYMASIAKSMLPHLSNRPPTLVRCPDGRHEQCFYQKHATTGVPSAVGRRREEISTFSRCSC